MSNLEQENARLIQDNADLEARNAQLREKNELLTQQALLPRDPQRRSPIEDGNAI